MKLIILLAYLSLGQIVLAQKKPDHLAVPKLTINFPDPTVINIRGTYYAYATQARHNDTMENIQLAVSQDLQHWNYVGDVLPTKPVWANQTQDFWAPHVLFDPALSKYVLFFSAKANDTIYDKCLGVAFSSSPKGPFIAEKEPLVAGKGFVNIDPMAIVDPVSKKKYLFWGSGFQSIRVQEMSADWKHFATDSKPTEVMQPGTEKKYTILIEGAWVDYYDSRYYLYYSGDNCCGIGASYAVMVARAAHITGPYTRLGVANGSNNSTILAADNILLAPGHNSIVRDRKGHAWIAYHGMTRLNDSTFDRTKRVFFVSPLHYINGWPQVTKQ